jgi:hypothetical protein
MTDISRERREAPRSSFYYARNGSEIEYAGHNFSERFPRPRPPRRIPDKTAFRPAMFAAESRS